VKIAVQDASVLIDLVETGLADRWFDLGIETMTSAMVWREVTRRAQKARLRSHVAAGRLCVASDDAVAMAELVVMQLSVSSRLSLPDLSVLRLAREEGAVLLTGDQLLAATARKAGVEAEGFGRILGLLVSRGGFPAAEATAVARRLGCSKLLLDQAGFCALLDALRDRS